MSDTPVTGQVWSVDIAGRPIDLPIVAIGGNLAIALMMVIDLGVDFLSHVGRELAERLAPLRPEIVVGAATLGIPIAIEISRALGLDHYVVLQKSPKIHLRDALAQPITSITSKGEQRLLLDRRSVPLLEGRRTVVVDDVVASGSSLAGALKLVRAAGAEVVGAGVVLTEAYAWRDVLAQDAASIVSLGHIPQFERALDGRWTPIEATLQGR